VAQEELEFKDLNLRENVALLTVLQVRRPYCLNLPAHEAFWRQSSIFVCLERSNPSLRVALKEKGFNPCVGTLMHLR
jgi:hypothetical protein